MAKQTSIRSNAVPQGGVTATTDATQGRALLPDTFTLKRMSEIFMEASEQNVIQLNQQTLIPGQAVNFMINNVGLGESLELWVEGSISIANASADTDQVLNVSTEFPFNLMSNINVQFNGQTVIINMSGYEALGIMAKRSKGIILGAAASAGAAFMQPLARIDKSLAYLTAGANVTFATGNKLCGVDTITVTKNTTGVINFGFYLEIPFTIRKDLLMGLIPMQNNSVYCNVALTCPSILGSTAASPLYGTIAATTTVSTTAMTVYPHYDFWAIPVPNNAQLYAYLVSHSYMLLSQGSNPIAKTGAEAFQYGMPNNYYLLSLLATVRYSTSALADIYHATTGLDNIYLNYNGTARIDRRKTRARFARDVYYRRGISSLPGQFILDLTDADTDSNGLNTTKWLNMYQANNPMLVGDVQSGFATAGSFSVLREQLVPANVQLI